MNYLKLNKEDLKNEYTKVKADYDEIKSQGLSLDLSRGKPGADILALSEGYMDKVASYKTAGGTDIRNYGILDGIPELKQLFSDLFEVPAENIIAGGNASLTYMYIVNSLFALYGARLKDGRYSTPWSSSETKILCPVPGYDRHWTISEDLGFQLIPVKMLGDGPDMDEVEQLVKNDSSVKAIWCVPLYSNPEGKVVSETVAQRLASMPTAAEDFKIFWDNAYGVHHVWEAHKAPDILGHCAKSGYEDRAYVFASTSKMTYPGAGVAMVASSPTNISEIKKRLGAMTIGYDKFAQIRTVEFFKDASGVRTHMAKLGEVLRAKFDIVLEYLQREFADNEVLSYTKPLGGYFVSVDVYPGCAKRVVELAKAAGVVLTGAGATWPYKKDPDDSNLRIAPSFPSIEELKKTMTALCVCVKLAVLESLSKC